MTQRKASLPSFKDILQLEKETKKELWDIFYHNEKLREYPGHLICGLVRLTEKSCMARTMISHMRERGIRTLDELAVKLYVGSDEIHVLEYLRFPAAFQASSNHKEHRDYLIALCDLEWDPNEEEYIPIKYERP